MALIATGDKAGDGAAGCTWTGEEVKPGAELKACAWTKDLGTNCPGTGSETAVWVCVGSELGARLETKVWTMGWTSACEGAEAKTCF